jgi:hypothetical protein
MCALTNNINDYYYVSQGKTTIPNVDDGEECQVTDVSDSVLVTAECYSKMKSVVVSYKYFHCLGVHCVALLLKVSRWETKTTQPGILNVFYLLLCNSHSGFEHVTGSQKCGGRCTKC